MKGFLFGGLLVLGPSLWADLAITFPRFNGQGFEQAVAIPVDDQGLLVTVGVVSADLQKAKSGEEALEFVGQEPQSRLTLLKGKSGGPVPKFGKGMSLQAGDKIFRNVDKSGPISRVVSWETSYKDQLLPLAFLRIHHEGVIPKPGTALFDEAGKMVAICHQPTTAFGPGCYALPVEAITRVVKDFQTHKEFRRCWIGVHLDAPHPVASIVGLRPESPATEAGVKKGDIILSVGDWPVRNYADAVNAFFYLVAEEEVNFEVLRGAKRLSLKMKPVADPRYGLKKD